MFGNALVHGRDLRKMDTPGQADRKDMVAQMNTSYKCGEQKSISEGTEVWGGWAVVRRLHQIPLLSEKKTESEAGSEKDQMMCEPTVYLNDVKHWTD